MPTDAPALRELVSETLRLECRGCDLLGENDPSRLALMAAIDAHEATLRRVHLLRADFDLEYGHDAEVTVRLTAALLSGKDGPQ